jgi:hypothetical protein
VVLQKSLKPGVAEKISVIHCLETRGERSCILEEASAKGWRTSKVVGSRRRSGLLILWGQVSPDPTLRSRNTPEEYGVGWSKKSQRLESQSSSAFIHQQRKSVIISFTSKDSHFEGKWGRVG